MKRAIDSSVAFKWVVPETDSDKAIRLRSAQVGTLNACSSGGTCMRPKRRRQIVSDPTICHGRPTFRGTRILVSDVLDLVADGMSWDDLVKECHGHITRSAIAEAIRCAGLAIVKHADEYAERPVGA